MEMPKFHVYPAEWWPVLTLDASETKEEVAEFSEEEILELKKLEQQLLDWQIKIDERFNLKVQRAVDFILVDDD